MSSDDLAWLDRLMTAILAAEAGPGAADLAAAPVIDLWRPLVSPSGALVLCGLVADHPRLGSTRVVTSQLVALDVGVGHARTASRWYRLGLGLPPAEAGTPRDPWFLCPPDPLLMPFEDLEAVARLLAVFRARVRKVRAAAVGHKRHTRL